MLTGPDRKNLFQDLVLWVVGIKTQDQLLSPPVSNTCQLSSSPFASTHLQHVKNMTEVVIFPVLQASCEAFIHISISISPPVLLTVLCLLIDPSRLCSVTTCIAVRAYRLLIQYCMAD
jgi:hypothetical protein